MAGIIKKIGLVGLGLLSITKAKAQEIVNELVKKGEVSKGEGAKLVKDLLEKAEEDKKFLEEKMEKAAKRILKKLDVPTRKEINELKKKIDKLTKK